METQSRLAKYATVVHAGNGGSIFDRFIAAARATISAKIYFDYDETELRADAIASRDAVSPILSGFFRPMRFQRSVRRTTCRIAMDRVCCTDGSSSAADKRPGFPARSK
jgi:hypothetical protein